MNLSGVLAAVKDRWQALSRNRKIAAVAVAAGVLVCLIGLLYLIFRPSYEPLFSGLDPKEAGAIAEELKALNIPYRLADQGKTIQVPKSQVYDARIQLASNGVLAGDGKGFDLFDQSKFGQSDFDQQVNYQRALQEELRRTVVAIDGVQDARVHLVIPKKSVFIDDQGMASASVQLTLKPGTQLRTEQVQGICDLMVGGVEGLTAENIHIIDNAGNVLSENLHIAANPDVVLTKATLEQGKLRREYENDLERRVRQMLLKISGENNYVIMVTAELDFSKQEITSMVNTNPDNVKISEQAIKETGRGTDYGGPVGTDSNVTTTPAAEGLYGSNYTRDENTINYQVSSTQETVVAEPGRVKRLSASVVVNDSADNPADVTKVRDAVAAAIGYNEARGDQINVSSMAFDDSQQRQLAAETAQAREASMRMWIIIACVAGAILLLAVLALFVYWLRRRREERLREEEEEIMAEESFIPVGDLEPEAKREDSKQEMIRRLAGERPEDIAEVLKVWLRD